MEQGTMVWAVVVVLVGMVVETTWGHGMMLKPTQRSSLWRYADRYPDVETNYDDNQLFCGGFKKQWEDNDGKCGTCGDPYNDPHPRDNEAGGKYGKGVIAETYMQGQLINVTIRITANHKGYFLFKLCPHNTNTPITQDCLDQNVLKTVDPNTGNLADKYYIGNFLGDKEIQVQLPSDVTCTQCVLQWTYNTGNSWGCFTNGTCCIGCGKQENFVNCADIAITACSDTGTTTTTTTTDAPATTDDPTTTTTTTTTVGPPPPSTRSSLRSATTKQPTTREPSTINTTTTTTTTTTATSATSTTTTAATTTTTAATTTTVDSDETGSQCKAVGVFVRVPGMDWWCDTNCAAGFCPPSHCTCL